MYRRLTLSFFFFTSAYIANEKTRLEEKQRAARRKREEANEEYHPRWFKRTQDGLWIYSGGYWESRANGKWTNIPDIY